MTRKQLTKRNKRSERDKLNETELYDYGVFDTKWNVIQSFSTSNFDSEEKMVKKNHLMVTKGMDDTLHLRVIDVLLSPKIDADAEGTHQQDMEGCE